MNTDFGISSNTWRSTASRRAWVSISALLLLGGHIGLSGCASPLDGWRQATTGAGKLSTGAMNRLAAGGRNMRTSWKRVTSDSAESDQPMAHRWNWTPAVPLDCARADLLAAEVPAASLVQCIPGAANSSVRLASTFPEAQAYRITHIDEKPVRDFGDLYARIDGALETDKPVQVDLTSVSDGRCSAYRVEPVALHALMQGTSPAVDRIRVADGGNPAIYFRQNGMGCKLMARVERQHELLHVVASFKNCGAREAILPVDVSARCDGEDLHCLSVDDTLEALYLGRQSARPKVGSEVSNSFAAASERADYLLPTKYDSLAGRIQELYNRSPSSSPLPAFANIPGATYPGPAVLGDSRALSGFFLQRQVYRPTEPERTGWIVFGGNSLKAGRIIELQVDLGDGPQIFRFETPQS